MDYKIQVPRDLRKWLKQKYDTVDCLAVWYDVEDEPPRVEFHASAYVNNCTTVILYGVWLSPYGAHVLFEQEVARQCDIFDLI